jgi:hypothetical protein
MILLNLFFVIVNGYLAIYWLNEKSEKWIGWVNLFAMVLNLIPVVGKLLT